MCLKLIVGTHLHPTVSQHVLGSGEGKEVYVCACTYTQYFLTNALSSVKFSYCNGQNTKHCFHLPHMPTIVRVVCNITCFLLKNLSPLILICQCKMRGNCCWCLRGNVFDARILNSSKITTSFNFYSFGRRFIWRTCEVRLKKKQNQLREVIIPSASSKNTRQYTFRFKNSKKIQFKL